MRKRTPGLVLGWIVVGSALSLDAFALDCPANSTDPKCKEQLQRQQQEAQQRAAQQKAQQEAQQRALQQQQQQQAQQKAMQEAQQKAQQQKAQQEAQQKALQQQEAQQKAQQQKAQQEAQQKALQQQEAQQKAQQQKAQQEAQQKALQQQKAQQEAQQKAQQQKAQQEAQQKAQQQPRAPQQPAQQAAPAAKPPVQQGSTPAKPQQATTPPPPQMQPPPKTAAPTTAPVAPPKTAAPTTTPVAPPKAAAPTPPPVPATKTAAPAAAPVTAPPAPTAKSAYPQVTPTQRSTYVPPPVATPTGRSLYQPTNAPTAPVAKNAGAPAQTAFAPRVPISAATAVVPRADKSGYAIQHREKDGSQIVVTQRHLPTGTVQAVGYRESADVRLGTTTRVYADGHRVIVGRDYQSHSLLGGTTYVTYKTGLRSAVLPSGKPIFRETFTTVRAPDGRDVRVIQKTVYVNQYYGRPVVLATPVVRVYEEAVFYGRPLYYYRPVYYAPVFYRPFWVPLPQPVVVQDDCAMCPSRAVAFAAPVTRYENPVDLMGDLQLSSAFDEAATRSPGETAQVAEVRNQMSELTRNVGARIETDTSLRAQVGGNPGADLQKVNQTMNELAPVQVPDEVRMQVRAQVRLTIAQLQNQHPAILSDVLKSGYAKIYLFQAAAPLNVQDAATGEECFINTGDLLGFAQLPASESPVALMKVVTSGAQSCQPRQLLNVPLTDLQDMMNAFSERVEDNLKRVNSCLAAPGSCVRA